jgi:biopolymer transport protein ExbD
MASRGRRIRASAEPNLTPILDMVFQLITFFMLVVSFKTASMDPGIRLPVLGSARPASQESESSFVVLNIDVAGELRVYGQVCDLEQYLVKEASSMRKQTADKGDHHSDEDQRTAAIIRADKCTPFTKLHHVMAVCKKLGFNNITLKVLDAPSSSGARDLPM